MNMALSRLVVFAVFSLFFGLADSDVLRVDCHPDKGATQQKCMARGCIWGPDNVPGIAYCYFNTSDTKFPGYDVDQVWMKSRNLVANLIRRKTPSLFGDDFETLSLKVDFLTESVLRVKFTPNQKSSQFVVRHKMVEKFVQHNTRRDLDTRTCLYDVTYQQQPFGLRVFRKDTNTSIFDTTNLPGLTFSKQFLQITTRLPSKNIYGFGEHNHPDFKRDITWKRWSMFNRDRAPDNQNVNLYGTHPFYMVLEDSGSAHGVSLHNSHAMDVALQPNPDLVTFRPIGGILEFYIFLGPKPASVVAQYTEVVGRPMMPPYWGLGFQLSRYGYKNTSQLEQIWQRNREAKIPQDIQYIDIDYMDKKKDFTFAHDTYKDLPVFVQKLHDMNMKLVLITDPGILSRSSENYPPLSEGLAMDVFIKENNGSKKPFEGTCWPGTTFWPDFTHPKAYVYWLSQHKRFHTQLQFDGMWYDMNEPSNMVSGQASTGSCPSNKLNNPPYVPVNDQNLYANTVCMDAMHSIGPHYAVHNMYGHSEVLFSNYVLKAVFPGKRPFLLSRSTFPGTGSYSAHWTGDVFSKWEQIQLSVVSMLEFQMFGIPWVGADICGFNGETSEEMCIRWSQLGAFYPFSRNHNDKGSKVEQDPAAWSPFAVSAIRDVLMIRYKLLSYLYTLFHETHTTGSPVVRPMFFEWPQDPETPQISDQFLWGSSLLVAPISAEDVRHRNVYFPKGRWFSYQCFQEIPGPEKSRTIDRQVPLNFTALFVRGGSIIPWQEPAETTTASRKNPTGVYVALNEYQLANGTLYWDDGESTNSYSSGNYLKVQFQIIQPGHLVITQQHNGMQSNECGLLLQTIELAGLPKKPRSVQVNGKKMARSQMQYFDSVKAMILRSCNIPLCEDALIQNVTWEFGE